MPVKYSPIAPLTLLEQMHDKEILGNYLLLLAHEVLEFPRGYIDLVDSLENTGENPRFIIMDNGVVELGKALPVLKVIDAANLVEADCIITPDSLGAFRATQKLVIEQSAELRNSGFPLMKVPQGDNLPELIQCADWLRDYLQAPNGDPDYWGIPRWIANELGSRVPMTHYLGMRTPNVQIHLLGMSKHLNDDLYCTTMPGVTGIDSANPLVLGLCGGSMSSPIYGHMERGNYWQCRELHSLARDNVEWMHANVG